MKYMLCFLVSIFLAVLTAQAPSGPSGNVRYQALVAVGVDGQWHPLSLDSNGELMAGSGAALLQPGPSGNVGYAAPVALGPDNAWHFWSVDANGNLQTTGGQYDPAAVAITGGTIDNVTLGGTTPVTLTSTSTFNVHGLVSSTLSTTLENNGGVTAFYGLDDSVGGGLAVGTAPYAAAMGTRYTSPTQFVVNNGLVGQFDTSGIFSVGSSSTTSSNAFQVTQAGLVTSAKTLTATSSAPGVSSNAGTGSLTHGTDNSGIIATGASSTATTLTFGVAWSTWASCTVSASTSTALPYVSAISKTAATFTYVTTGTPTLYYNCNGD